MSSIVPLIRGLSPNYNQKNRYDYHQLEVIPQFSKTCWFNSMLMALLYSEGLRAIIYKEAVNWIKKAHFKENKFLRFIIYMLKFNYSKPEKIRVLFEKRLRTEFLLLTFARTYDPEIKTEIEQMIKRNSYDYYSYYIIILLARLGINYLDLYYINGELFTDLIYNLMDFNQINSKLHEQSPEVLVVFNSNIYHYQMSNDRYKTSGNEDKKKIPEALYSQEQFDSLSEIISFNGSLYKLDACLVGNYNKQKTNHIILGLTYNSQPFVYNGWLFESKENFEQQQPCKLFEWDWKGELRRDDFENTGFCLSRKECEILRELQEDDLCFNFSRKINNACILLYTKINEDDLEEPTDRISLFSNSALRTTNVRYTSQGLKEKLDYYYLLQSKTIQELKELLIIIGYNEETINSLTRDDVKFYNYELYQELVKDEAINFADFLKALIQSYFNDKKIYKIITNNDYKRFLESKTIEELKYRFLATYNYVPYNLDSITSFTLITFNSKLLTRLGLTPVSSISLVKAFLVALCIDYHKTGKRRIIINPNNYLSSNKENIQIPNDSIRIANAYQLIIDLTQINDNTTLQQRLLEISKHQPALFEDLKELLDLESNNISSILNKILQIKMENLYLFLSKLRYLNENEKIERILSSLDDYQLALFNRLYSFSSKNRMISELKSHL